MKNRLLVDQFNLLVKYIKQQIDTAPDKGTALIHSYRLRQVKNIIKIIIDYPYTIKSGEQLKHIKGVGKGTVSRIDEILKTGSLSEIKLVDNCTACVEELEQVVGIGRKTAYNLVNNYNIKNVKQLMDKHKNGEIKLNNQILVGLKYHKIYKRDIPRTEMDKINVFISKQLNIVDRKLIGVLCGSYRRQKPVSNDIDVLLTHPNKNYMIEFIKHLIKIKFLVDDMSAGKTKYSGFCRLNKNYPVRRIDVRFVPYDSYYTALLYFTGSKLFNMKIRRLAIDLGYKLNEYGLYKGKKKIKIKSEKDIFDVLGLEYIKPENR